MHICNLAAGFCAVHNNPSVAKTWTLNRLGKSIWSYYWHFLSNLNNTRKTLVKPATGWGRRHVSAMYTCHTGKPNSPFSAKHHPFQAQTTRSRHTIPVLGLILPFTAQSHPPFSVFWRVPHMCCLLQDTIAVVGTSQGMARSTKSNHKPSPETTMVNHKD